MANVYADNSLSIGRTPLVKLNRVTEGAKATVLAKIEGRNPAYSVKCRIGAAMIWDAEKRGVLKPGIEIVEDVFAHVAYGVCGAVGRAGTAEVMGAVADIEDGPEPLLLHLGCVGLSKREIHLEIGLPFFALRPTMDVAAA